MNKTFKLCYEGSYNLQHENTFKIPLANTVYNCTEIASFLGPKPWELIPMKIKGLGISVISRNH